MNLAYDLDTITTRLPPINRTQPNAFFDSMKDLVPSPLKKARSPSRPSHDIKQRRPSDNPFLQPVPARKPSAWESYPSRRAEERSARSLSPKGSDRAPAHARARTPPPPRSSSLVPVQVATLPPVPAQTSAAPLIPGPRYNVVTREFQTAPEIEQEIPPAYSYRGLPLIREVPNSQEEPEQPRGRERNMRGLRQGMRPGPQFGMGGAGIPRRANISESLTPEPLNPKPKRKAVPSMHEYLSLKQLEGLWEDQDLYGGGMADAPCKPQSPMWRLQEQDPRSPILPIHPAFRNESPFHNSFARDDC